MFKTLCTMPVLFILAFAASANAGLLFEPYAGYAVGSIALKIADTASVSPGYTDSGSINGFGYGGRVGFLLQHFVIVAAEYQAITAKEKFSKSTTITDWTQKTMFATIGFQAPRGFRLMGSYGWDFQADEASTPNPTHYKGTALKFAIGFHLPMPVALNLEYTIYKLTDYTQNAVSAKISDTYSKLDYSTVMATLSFPFELFHMSGGGGEGRHRQ